MNQDQKRAVQDDHLQEVSFDGCPNCGLHGHNTIRGQELPEARSQEIALLQVVQLAAGQDISVDQAQHLVSQIMTSSLFPTVKDLMAMMFGQELMMGDINRRRDPDGLFDTGDGPPDPLDLMMLLSVLGGLSEEQQRGKSPFDINWP